MGYSHYDAAVRGHVAWNAGVDPVSPDSRRLGLGTEAQELAW